MKRLILLGLAAMVVVLAGCSSAGPFVTNVTPDGRGGLIVEKATVSLNGLTGEVSTGNRQTYTVQVCKP